MSEDHPSLLMSESAPGRGWKPVPTTDAPAQAPQAQMPDDPQQAFTRLAEQASRTLNISLSDAYGYVSKEAPVLWERATKAAML